MKAVIKRNAEGPTARIVLENEGPAMRIVLKRGAVTTINTKRIEVRDERTRAGWKRIGTDLALINAAPSLNIPKEDYENSLVGFIAAAFGRERGDYMKKCVLDCGSLEIEANGFGVSHAVFAYSIGQSFYLKAEDIMRDESLSYCKRYESERGPLFSSFDTLFDAFFAASEIIRREKPDIAVGIANGALPISFIFSYAGLETINIRLKRKGRGHVYKALGPLEKVRGKKVLLVENDMVTGGTIKRAVKEITAFSPSSISFFAWYLPEGSQAGGIPPSLSPIFCLSDFHSNEAFNRELAEKILKDKGALPSDFSFSNLLPLIEAACKMSPAC